MTPSVSRRAFLGLASMAGLGFVCDRLGVSKPRQQAQPNTVNTWSGTVNLTGPVTINAGDTQRFDPNADTTVTIDCTGNKGLEVQGTLEMKPGVTAVGAERQHRLIFSNVSESGFVGGGTTPLSTDPGLWVTGAGRLDILGRTRTGWARSSRPSNWRSADELVKVPAALGDYTTFSTFGYNDTWPSTVKTGFPAPEVMNLSRTVRIEGTSGHRAHVFIRSSAAQSIKYAAFRYMGPQQSSAPVLGRYPVHFHMCDDLGSPSSVVTGCVVRDSGAHAFVPHMSSGITFDDCVGYGITEDAYWWDPHTETSNTVYNHCLAAKVDSPNAPDKYLVTGFNLGAEGTGNTIKGCVAVGTLGDVTSSGIHWPERFSDETTEGVWVFTKDANGNPNVSHNNECHGTYSWQNDDLDHVVEDFVVYRNGLNGINFGAYVNEYRWLRTKTYQNGNEGNPDSDINHIGGEIVIHSGSNDLYDHPASFEDYDIDGGGVGNYGIAAGPSPLFGVDPHVVQVLATGGTVTGTVVEDYYSTDPDVDFDELVTVS